MGGKRLNFLTATFLFLVCSGECAILRPRRDAVLVNLVTLSCLNVRGEVIADADFFLDGEDLESRVRVLRFNHEASFSLTPNLEGQYTCSSSLDGDQSSPVPLIVLPSDQITLSYPAVVYAEYGSTAVLDCSLTPGNLYSQYYATWSNMSDFNQVYASLPVPSRDGSVFTDAPSTSRYSISRTSLALTITNVTLSDSSMTYQCLVGVVNPHTGDRLTFRRTASVSIGLVVYKSPKIIKPPRSKTVSLQESRQVRYECVAVGAVGEHSPQITWTHNGNPTTSPTQYHIFTTNSLDPEGRGFLVNSSLSIFPLDETSTGNVSCTVGVSSAAQREVVEAIPSEIVTARLSVLGGFKDVGILVTQGGDVIFKLTLQATINIPVNVLMVYTDAKKEGTLRVRQSSVQSNRTTATSFNNTDAITLIVFRSQIPFDVFRVGVALVSGSVEGLVQNNTRVHNVHLPSLVSTSMLQTQLIVASVVPILFFVLLFVVVFTCILVRYFGKRRRRELEFRKSILDRHVDVLEILLEKLPDDPSGDVYVQMLQVVEHILTINTEECSSSSPSIEGDRSSERGKTELEMVDCDLPEMSLKSSAFVRTLGNVIEKGRKNPKLRPHLDRHMSTIILEERNENVFPPLPPGACYSDVIDAGYAGSNSSTSQDDRELDRKVELQ